MLAASVGEAAACLVRVPTEVIKAKMQTNKTLTLMSTIRAVWQEGGSWLSPVTGGLYRGYGITLFREIPFAMIQFPLYERLKVIWSERQGGEDRLHGNSKSPIVGFSSTGTLPAPNLMSSRTGIDQQQQHHQHSRAYLRSAAGGAAAAADDDDDDGTHNTSSISSLHHDDDDNNNGNYAYSDDDDDDTAHILSSPRSSQLKAVLQDCTVQRIHNAFTVDGYESHAKIALEEADLNEYNQCQTQLKELYILSKTNPVATANRVEFLTYRLLYYVFLSGNEKYNGGSAYLFHLMMSLTLEERQALAIRHA